MNVPGTKAATYLRSPQNGQITQRWMVLIPACPPGTPIQHILRQWGNQNIFKGKLMKGKKSFEGDSWKISCTVGILCL